jgi:hypothetical protein
LYDKQLINRKTEDVDMFRSTSADALYAQSIANEDKHKRISVLQAEAANLEFILGEGLCRPIDADGLRIQLQNIQIEIRQLQQPAAPLAQPVIGNSNLIHARLGIEMKHADYVTKAQPLRLFTAEEIEKITHHYDSLADHLKALLDATIFDDITSEIIPQPVFIRGEGHIYNINTPHEWLGDNEDKLCPQNPGRRFNKNDIIPCNTLINAMIMLLNIINGEERIALSAENNIAMMLKDNKRARVSAEQIALIEQLYEKFPSRHQALFDSICRDPITGQIMDDPVLLPDGYVYDSNTAKLFLTTMKGRCPLNPEISFTKEDVTPCQFVVAVLDQLKENADRMIAASKGIKGKVALNPLELEYERSMLEQKITTLLQQAHAMNENKAKSTNPDMEAVLQAALQALHFARPEILQAAIKNHPHFNQVKTMIGIKTDSSTRFGRFYGAFAKTMGTVTGQPGNVIEMAIKKVMTALVSYAAVIHQAAPKNNMPGKN